MTRARRQGSLFPRPVLSRSFPKQFWSFRAASNHSPLLNPSTPTKQVMESITITEENKVTSIELEAKTDDTAKTADGEGASATKKRQSIVRVDQVYDCSEPIW
jgi:hypothetical protein